MEKISEILDIIRTNDSYRKNTLNMIAAENVTSPIVSNLYNNGFKHRYACGTVGNRAYAGCKWVDELETITEELVKELFECDHVNLYPISGVVANLISFSSLLRRNDKVCVVEPSCGSHYSHHKRGMLGIAGMNPVFLPFNLDQVNIDLDKTERIINKEKPSMLILGASEMLFPVPIKEIRTFFDKIILYDAAHVLGLIAGGKFQKPLKEGADLISTSTHKTFFGPQGGMLLTNSDEIYNKTIDRTFDIVSNHHIHRLPALAATCLEMLDFGKDYAQAVVSNAKALGNYLFQKGMDILGSNKGFTETHQIIMNVSKIGNNNYVMKTLESANIITSPCPIPGNHNKETGIRFGVQELTRVGMRVKEMKIIGELVVSLLKNEKNEEEVREEVIELAQKFHVVRYSFGSLESLLNTRLII